MPSPARLWCCGTAPLSVAPRRAVSAPPFLAPLSWRAALTLPPVCSALRSTASSMIHFVLLISRQGKVRLTKWYSPYSSKEKARTVREVSAVVLSRQQKQCNFLEYKDKKVIYKRCASTCDPALAHTAAGDRGRGRGRGAPGGRGRGNCEAGWSYARAQMALGAHRRR